mgnify:FL=1|tara:strand:- start:3105 stop:3476 length:372 start_codon:yes stop_codon:yes gene_type:complete
MLKGVDKLVGDEAQKMLKEILGNQKEALDLNGQLVLLNQKMDTLIEAVGKQASKPKSAFEALLSNGQALTSFVFIILVALFLGLGEGVIDRFMGPSSIDHESIQNVIQVLRQAAEQTASVPVE